MHYGRMDGSEVSAIRTELKLSHEELARILDVHRITVQRWERGSPKVPRATALALRALRQQGARAVSKLLVEAAA